MNDLSIEKFDSLVKTQQADIVHNFGVYLLDFKSHMYIYALYSLSNFYVEMIYRKEGTILVSVKSKRSVNDINRYVKRIDISELGI